MARELEVFHAGDIEETIETEQAYEAKRRDQEREASRARHANSKEQRLSVNNGRDVHFKGAMLHEYSTQNRDATKDRWSEIRLWETADGSWVIEQLGCSNRNNEAHLRDVQVIETRTLLATDQGNDEQRKLRVMDFLGWTTVAKAFARAAGWDVALHVD